MLGPMNASDAATAQRRPSPLRRWMRRLAWLLLGCYAAYLVAGNLYLNTPLGPWSVNRKPEKFAMHWGRALTWWPGEIVLWKVSLRGHVGRVVWTMQADRVAGHISLLNLVHKEVYVPRVRATEVTGQIASVAQEIPPPPVRPGGWLLNFPDITSDSVRGGTLGPLTLEGQGTAKVGFTKRLRGGPAELLLSTAHFEHLRLGYGQVALLEDATLGSEFAMTPTTRAQAKGIGKLRRMRIALDVAGGTPALAARQSDAGKLELTLQPGQGRVQGALKLVQAELAPGGVLSWRMPVVITDVHGQVHRSTLTAQLSVDRDLHLKANMPPQTDGVLALDADLRADGTLIPFEQPRTLLPRTSGRLAGQWQFSSLKWVTSLFVNVPWLSLDGAGRVQGDVTLDHGVLAVGSHLEIPHVQAQADVVAQRVTGTGSAKARLEAGEGGRPRSRVDVALTDYSVAAIDQLKRPYIRGKDLKLHTDSDADLAKARESLKAQATFTNAQVPDLRAYNRFLPNDHLRFDGGSGTLTGQLALDAAGQAGNGQVRIAARAAQVRAAGLAMRGDVDVDLRLKRADLQRQRFAVDGSTVALKNISFAHAGLSRSGWWANVSLPRAQMDVADERLAVQGTVSTQMKDVGFLLDLFSQDRDYPGWMVKLVDAGTVRASTRVRWRQHDLVLDDIDARNDRFDLVGRFRLQGRDKAQGDLYARWGVLGAAVELRNGAHTFHLLGAKRWYEAQPGYLD